MRAGGHVTGPPLRRDPDTDVASLRAWDGLPAGPAGLVTVEPADGVLLAFDAADLARLVELQIDVAVADPEVIRLLGTAPQATELTLPPSSVLRTLARRALLEGLSPRRPLQGLDAALLDLDLPPQLRGDDSLGEGARALLAMPASSWRGLSPGLQEELAAAAQRLADELWDVDEDLAGQLDGLALHRFDEAERQAEPRMLRARMMPSGAMPTTAMRMPDAVAADEPIEAVDELYRPVLVDPRMAEANGIDGSSVTARRYGGDEPLTVEVDVIGELGVVWARAWAPEGGGLVAVGRLVGRGPASAQLAVSPTISLGELELDLVDDPRSPRATNDELRVTAATRAGWAALAAERTEGDGWASFRAWQASADSWERLGDPDRTALAADYAGQSVRVVSGVTWAGPLLGQPRDRVPPFLHERVPRPGPPRPPRRRGRSAPMASGRGWYELPDDEEI